MTHRLRTFALLAAGTACAASLSACGDDRSAATAGPTPSTEAPLSAEASAIADDLQGDGDEPFFARDEAECFGTTLLESPGRERLVELGVLDADGKVLDIDAGADKLTKERATAFSECVGLTAMAVRWARFGAEVEAETAEEKALVADDDYWAAVTACMEGKLPEEEAIAAALGEAGPDDGPEARQAAADLETCREESKPAS